MPDCVRCGEPLEQGQRKYHKECFASKEKERGAAKAVSLLTRYNNLKAAAKKHGISFHLTLDLYTELMSYPCYWCNDPLPKTGHGVDRLNLDQSYNMVNCLPSCKYCMAARGGRTCKEFTDWILRLSRITH